MEIAKTEAHYNMSNYNKVKQGNSLTEYISDVGCYITTFANVLWTAFSKYETKFRLHPWNTPTHINSRKDLFSKVKDKEACFKNREDSMDAIFGEGNWDYWTKGNQGKDGLLEKLSEYDKDVDKYMIVGIFDLHKATANVTNHMVAINSMPNEDGIFENITPTSNGDIKRLNDSTKKLEYSMDNLKEFRVVKVSEFYKRFSEGMQNNEK